MGGGRSSLRYVRLLALVAILVAGATLHDRGSTYTVLRILYFVVIFGALGLMLLSRRRGGSRVPGRGPGGGWGPPPGGGPENTDPESEGESSGRPSP